MDITVKQLIEELQRFNDDDVVYVYFGETKLWPWEVTNTDDGGATVPIMVAKRRIPGPSTAKPSRNKRRQPKKKSRGTK